MASLASTPAAAKPGTGKTVLVTDDHPELRELTVRLIGRRGHRVLEAANGTEAIALCERQRIDLLLLDVVMPDLDGFETLARLRAGDHMPLLVIMLTAKDSDESVMAGYQAGVDFYLTKPFRAAALLNIVDYLIGDLSPSDRAKIEAQL